MNPTGVCNKESHNVQQGVCYTCITMEGSYGVRDTGSINNNDGNKRSDTDVGNTSSIGEILKERGNRYGEFWRNANLSQDFKILAREAVEAKGDDLPAYMEEALDMMFNKLARILNGDHYYDDSWKDIAGYAQLVVDELENK